MGHLILDDIRKGEKMVVVLDGHGTLATDVLVRLPPEAVPRTVYFCPFEQKDAALGLNPFELQDERDYELKFEALMNVFSHLWWGSFREFPTMQNTLETLIETVLAGRRKYQTHFEHLQFLIQFDDNGRSWRERLRREVKNPVVQAKWEEWRTKTQFLKDVQSSKNKINHILLSRNLRAILCHPASSACFNFPARSEDRQVLICNFYNLNDEEIMILGSIIVTQLVAMAKARAREDRDYVPCHLYADEFPMYSHYAFLEIIDRMQKYGLYCTLAHQGLSQLTTHEAREAVKRCGNRIYFRVGSDDDVKLMSTFDREKGIPVESLMGLDYYTAAAILAKKKSFIQTLVTTRDYEAAPNPKVAEAVMRHSMRSYGRRTHGRIETDQAERGRPESDEVDWTRWLYDESPA
jgi:hypothetical protein